MRYQSQSREIHTRILDTIITQQLRTLFSPDEPTEESEVIIKDEPLSDTLAEKASEEVNYHPWAQIKYYLGHIPGSNVARKKWDNLLNQEYITIVPTLPGHELTIHKFYTTQSSDGYFKKVEHTFKPTQEDQEAEDWYIL